VEWRPEQWTDERHVRYAYGPLRLLAVPTRASNMSAAPITTIRELVQELLRHRDTAAYAGILARYAVPGHDLEPYIRWNSRHYTRNCVVRNDDLELLVICYEPGQRTSIHDYDSQTAWINVVQGEVLEERFGQGQYGGLQLVRETGLRTGMVEVMESGNSIHRFTNQGPGRAVTINLYAKPLSKWRVYDEGSGLPGLVPAVPTS
jgi:cysteine dioxygenase